MFCVEEWRLAHFRNLPISQVSLSYALNVFRDKRGSGRLHTGMLSEVSKAKYDSQRDVHFLWVESFLLFTLHVSGQLNPSSAVCCRCFSELYSEQ
jgi:hypothetical protein